ncbi:hypothetical protein WA026_015511 [Henosepilachna vigintioctopunctata]|uniref:ATR-interacting protein n=1 Tax=Henosepilachna vigintioctopunctata TaxID=420089 RepID=A0AAW1VE25_9CUCU
MSKRPGDLITNDSKKQKLNNLDNTLWDDDVDDDCFGEIASKILEQDGSANTQSTQGNVSFLPTYESFKPNIPFASTQNTQGSIFKEPHKSNGFGIKNNCHELEIKVMHLQKKFEEKEGEVTVLRAQIQKIKSDAVEDLSKKHKDYIQNTTLKEKELRSIKGELEFKNLEIANLKQKINEISKAGPSGTNDKQKNKNLNLTSVGDCSKGTGNSKRVDPVVDIDITILQEPDFPLLTKFPPNFFTNLPPEVHVVPIKVNQFGKNTVPYLHNQTGQEDFVIPSGPKVKMKIGKEEVGIEYIYPEIVEIIKSDIDQLNSEDFKPFIVKILCVSLQLLEYLKEYLEILEKHYRTEDIEELEKNFIDLISIEYKKDNKEEHKFCEIGVRAGLTVQLIAELIPYNTYLADYILLSKPVELDANLSKNLPCLKNIGKDNHYFILLNDIIKKIFFLRKTEVCHILLKSAGLLLLNISKSDLPEKSFSIFCALTGSLLYTRPPLDILYQILIVVKNCSKSKYFVEYLCQKPESKKITTDKKRKIHYFMEESCKFTLFVALLRRNLQNIVDEQLSLDIAINVMSFIYNIFMMNPCWMHDEQKDQ